MRLSRLFALVAVIAGVAVVTTGQPEAAATPLADPTFVDVAPVFYRSCTGCHRPGGLGPFSLLEYETAKVKLGKMKAMVRSGRMPPWQATGPKHVFRNDRRLSDEEKDLIVRWLDSGAKPGDLSKLPPRPQYVEGWEMGTPDLIVSMNEEFTVPASGEVEYMYFEVPTNLTEEKWVQAIEIMPGSREAVHHVLVYARAPMPPAAQQAAVSPAPVPATATAQPPRPPLFTMNPAHRLPPNSPRRDSTHPPPRNRGPLIGSTAPGTNMVVFPEGTALRLRPGTIITFQMHYTAHGHEAKDRTSVGFRFAKEMPREEIFASQFTNGAFVIPPGARDFAVPAELAPTQDVKIWGLLPHTHLRGTRWLYKLEKADSTSEVVLDVPRYDFNWQIYYLFEQPLVVPAGAKLTSMAWYDNSTSNKDNPDATKEVRWGDQTWEEMQYTGILYSVPGRVVRPSPR